MKKKQAGAEVCKAYLKLELLQKIDKFECIDSKGFKFKFDLIGMCPGKSQPESCHLQKLLL